MLPFLKQKSLSSSERASSFSSPSFCTLVGANYRFFFYFIFPNPWSSVTTDDLSFRSAFLVNSLCIFIIHSLLLLCMYTFSIVLSIYKHPILLNTNKSPETQIYIAHYYLLESWRSICGVKAFDHPTTLKTIISMIRRDFVLITCEIVPLNHEKNITLKPISDVVLSLVALFLILVDDIICSSSLLSTIQLIYLHQLHCSVLASLLQTFYFSKCACYPLF